MANINNLLKALKNNEYIRSFKPEEVDIVDLLGGSVRSINDFLDIGNEGSAYGSIELAGNPILRLLSKPIRMGTDAIQLLGNPKWSLKNNKIGLTKDALLIKLLADHFNKNDEEELEEDL